LEYQNTVTDSSCSCILTLLDATCFDFCCTRHHEVASLIDSTFRTFHRRYHDARLGSQFYKQAYKMEADIGTQYPVIIKTSWVLRAS